MSETSPTIGFLHITAHLINGRRQQFLQRDAKTAQQVLDQLRIDRVFAQKHFIFASEDSVTVIPSDSIERLEVRADFPPPLPHNAPIMSVAEVTEDDFNRAHRAPDEDNGPKIFMLAELRSGTTMYLRFHLEPRGNGRPELTPDDSGRFLTHLFTRPVVFGTTEDRLGIFLLHPATIDRFTIAPAPPVETPGSWAMNRYAP